MKSNVSCVVLVCLLWTPAHGQSPPAMECDANEACVALVEQGQKQSKGGQLEEAEKSYKLAYAVSHDARLLFNIARVLDKRGQGPEAQTYYRQFIESEVEEPEQKAKAREYVAQLEAKLATAQSPQTVSPPMTSPTAPTASTASTASTAPTAPTTSTTSTTPTTTTAPPPPTAVATTPSLPLPTAPTSERKVMPVYKRGWFWGVMVGSVAAVGLGIGLGVGLSNRGPTVPIGTNTVEPTF